MRVVTIAVMLARAAAEFPGREAFVEGLYGGQLLIWLSMPIALERNDCVWHAARRPGGRVGDERPQVVVA